jgi:hypothetical protein
MRCSTPWVLDDSQRRPRQTLSHGAGAVETLGCWYEEGASIPLAGLADRIGRHSPPKRCLERDLEASSPGPTGCLERDLEASSPDQQVKKDFWLFFLRY